MTCCSLIERRDVFAVPLGERKSDVAKPVRPFRCLILIVSSAMICALESLATVQPGEQKQAHRHVTCCLQRHRLLPRWRHSSGGYGVIAKKSRFLLDVCNHLRRL